MVLRQVRRIFANQAAQAVCTFDVAAEWGDVKSRKLHATTFFGQGMTESQYDVAVLVPCYNEARAIAKVVADFRAALPDATIYVYDNNSTDGTVEAAQRARSAGARTRARATWCGACSTTSRLTSTCWSTATPPTTHRARRR